MRTRENAADAQRLGLLAGAALRPGIPTALWLDGSGPGRTRRPARRKRLRGLLIGWLG